MTINQLERGVWTIKINHYFNKKTVFEVQEKSMELTFAKAYVAWMEYLNNKS